MEKITDKISHRESASCGTFFSDTYLFFSEFGGYIFWKYLTKIRCKLAKLDWNGRIIGHILVKIHQILAKIEECDKKAKTKVSKPKWENVGYCTKVGKYFAKIS